MEKVKKFFRGLAAFAIMWLVARFVPAFLLSIIRSKLSLGYFSYYLVNAVLYLPALWFGSHLALKISDLEVDGAVQFALAIFVLIEGSGILESVIKLIELFSRTGQYNMDEYGVYYSDYFAIYGTGLVYAIIYVYMCISLYKKAKNPFAKKGK